MPEQLILDKLDKMEKKVDKIELAVGLIAVQNERINNVASQVHTLWEKHEDVSKKVIAAQNFQAACPKIDFRADLSRQWAVIGLLTTLVCGTILKAFGIIK